MRQSQLGHLEDDFLYLLWFSLHFCVLRWGLMCVCVCACELCVAFEYYVSTTRSYVTSLQT